MTAIALPQQRSAHASPPGVRGSEPALRLVPPPAPADAGPQRSGRHRRPPRLMRWWRQVVDGARGSGDAGMATAEYAIVTVAAAAFAGLLIVILRSDEVRGLLTGIVRGALSV